MFARLGCSRVWGCQNYPKFVGNTDRYLAANSSQKNIFSLTYLAFKGLTTFPIAGF